MDKKRIIYFDVLNILAAFAVVLIHCNGMAHTYSNTIAWYQALFVEVFVYWCVPIFFMLSGATLFNYRERYTTIDFFKKRFLRAVIPFLAWSLISAAYKGINFFKIGFKDSINMFFGCKIEGVYWFFIPLFAVYLSMPVITLLKGNRRILWYMAGGSFVLSSLLPPVFGYLNLSWNPALSMLTCGGYLMYVILGYLFSTEQLSKTKRIWIYILGVFGGFLRYFATIILSIRDGKINNTFFSYTAYYAVFLSIAVFVFVKNSKLLNKLGENQRFAKVVKLLADCSLGIYLLHMIIYRVLDDFIPANCWEWRILVPFLIYIIAFVVIWLCKKIPFVKYIVP